jgi:hypothetical protein
MPQFKDQVVRQLIVTDGAGNTISITAGPPPKIVITGNGEFQIINEDTGQELDLRLSSLGNPIIQFTGRTADGGKVFKLSFDEGDGITVNNKYNEYGPSFSQTVTQSAAGWYVWTIPSGEGVGFDPTDAEFKMIDAGSETFEDWTNLTLQNGWTAKVGYYAPAYRFTPTGQIELRGVMTGGTSVDNTVIALMPLAPVKLGTYGGVGITAGGSALKRVFYNTDSKLYCYGVSGTGDLALDGARFSYK